VDDAHAAEIGRGGESGHVANYATTGGYQHGAAVRACMKQLAGERFNGLQVLRGLAVIEQYHL
jgi:hypothetical protein